MRGAPARAIQELAGHQDLATTQRHMHLSPAAIEGAIRLLDQPKTVREVGDILEAAGDENLRSLRYKRIDGGPDRRQLEPHHQLAAPSGGLA